MIDIKYKFSLIKIIALFSFSIKLGPFLRGLFLKRRMSKMKACLGYLRRGGKKDCRNQDNDYDDVSKEFFISDSYNQHTLQVFTIDKGNG